MAETTEVVQWWRKPWFGLFGDMDAWFVSIKVNSDNVTLVLPSNWTPEQAAQLIDLLKK